MTSPGKGVQEQHYFSVHAASVHQSVTPSPKPLERFYANLLHVFPVMVRVCEINILSHRQVIKFDNSTTLQYKYSVIM